MSLFVPFSAHAQTAIPRAELDISSNGNAAISAGLFVPFDLGDGTVLFADGWLSHQDSGLLYGSLGGGVRRQMGDWVLGAHAHLDFVNSHRNFSYQQLSAGLEALSESWEFRINGFAPIGQTANEIDGLTTVKVRNGQLVANQGYEVALYGVNAEAGIRLPVFDSDGSSSVKLFAGAFVTDSAFTDAITGATLRAELILGLDQYLPGATVSLGGGMKLDSTSHLSASAHIRLSAPIGGAPVSTLASDPIYQRVERDRAVALKAGALGVDELAFGASGSAQILQISAQSGGGAAINQQIATAGKGAIILASGDIALDQTLVLASNQILLGGGGVIDVTTASGRATQFRNPGAATVLSGAGARPAPVTRALAAPLVVDGIQLADGSTVSTLSILGTNNAIVANGVNNITIDNVIIDGVAGNGIALRQVTGARIGNTTIRNSFICETSRTCSFSHTRPSLVRNAAINAVGVQDLAIRNVDIHDVTFGIFAAADIDVSSWPEVVNAPSRAIEISDVSITNTRREGVILVGTNDVSIERLSIDNTAMARTLDLIVLQDAHDISMNNMILRGGVNGLMLAQLASIPGHTSDITVSNSTFSRMSRSGVFLNPTSNITFNNVSISDVGGHGIRLHGDAWGFMGGPSKAIAFNGVSIVNSAEAGLYLYGPAENLSGALSSTGPSAACSGDHATWAKTSLTQAAGFEFSVNGTVVTGANLTSVCP